MTKGEKGEYRSGELARGCGQRRNLEVGCWAGTGPPPEWEGMSLDPAGLDSGCFDLPCRAAGAKLALPHSMEAQVAVPLGWKSPQGRLLHRLEKLVSLHPLQLEFRRGGSLHSTWEGNGREEGRQIRDEGAEEVLMSSWNV